MHIVSKMKRSWDLTFAGSGKTTLIGHLLRQRGNLRFAVVVNEVRHPTSRRATPRRATPRHATPRHCNCATPRHGAPLQHAVACHTAAAATVAFPHNKRRSAPKSASPCCCAHAAAGD